MSLNCPKCGDAMRNLTIGQVIIDQCPSCSGIWFDEGELQRVLAAGGRKTLKQLSTENPANPDLDVKAATCPRQTCTDAMIRVANPGNAELFIDACPNCGGVWYDGGEVDDLLADTVGEKLGSFVKSIFKSS